MIILEGFVIVRPELPISTTVSSFELTTEPESDSFFLYVSMPSQRQFEDAI
jgi:hypothetical protein